MLPARGAEPLCPVVVTLDGRSDRWQRIQSSLARAGIRDVVKFRAVHGSAISDDTRDALIDPDSDIDAAPRSHLALTRPAAGCFLSHLQIWKQFLLLDAERGAEQLVVLEDDASPAAGYGPAQARAIVSSLPANADLVLLGCSIMGDLAADAESGPLKRVFYFNGTYAYLLTRRGCLNLLPYLVPMRAHIDHQISAALIKNPDSLFAYAATPTLFDHDWSTRSDAYVPLDEPEAADEELGALIESARQALRHSGAGLP
jgi:hypothetical protein